MNFVYAFFALLFVAQYLEYQGNGDAGFGVVALKNGIQIEQDNDGEMGIILKSAAFIRSNQEEKTVSNCGGTVIANKLIITAGHCVPNADHYMGGFTIGQTKPDQDKLTHENFLTYWVRAPGYEYKMPESPKSPKSAESPKSPKSAESPESPIVVKYDMAVIKSTSDVKFHSMIPLVDREFSLSKYDLITVRVIGYGAGILEYADFKMITGEWCKELYPDAFSDGYNLKAIFCIPYVGVSINEGNPARTELKDFGSGVFWKKGGKDWHLIGVSSCNRFTKCTCKDSGEEAKWVERFAIVENVAYYQDREWMNKLLKKASMPKANEQSTQPPTPKENPKKQNDNRDPNIETSSPLLPSTVGGTCKVHQILETASMPKANEQSTQPPTPKPNPGDSTKNLLVVETKPHEPISKAASAVSPVSEPGKPSKPNTSEKNISSILGKLFCFK